LKTSASSHSTGSSTSTIPVGRGELRVGDVRVERRLREVRPVLEDRERARAVDHDLGAVLDRFALPDRPHALDPAVRLDDVLDHGVVVDLRARVLRAGDQLAAVLPAVKHRQLPRDRDLDDRVVFGEFEPAVVDVRVRHRRLDPRPGDRGRERIGALERVATGDVARLLLGFPFDDRDVVARPRDGRRCVTAGRAGADDHHVVLARAHTRLPGPAEKTLARFPSDRRGRK